MGGWGVMSGFHTAKSLKLGALIWTCFSTCQGYIKSKSFESYKLVDLAICQLWNHVADQLAEYRLPDLLQ